jgi:hypothetical protein
MNKCKDIPLAADIKEGTEIEVQTEHGIIPLNVWRVVRGTGKRKWCISIQGFTRIDPPIRTQCYVFFKGNEVGSQFTQAEKHNLTWDATLETIISIPEFWGESQQFNRFDIAGNNRLRMEQVNFPHNLTGRVFNFDD